MVTVTKLRSGNVFYTFEKGDLINEVDLPTGTPVGICPKCGEQLVVRTGKNGKFIGCEGFAKHSCKSTYNLKSFKAIKKMEISLMRDRRAGHCFELRKSLHIKE